MATELDRWAEKHELFCQLMEMRELFSVLGFAVCEPKHSKIDAHWFPVLDLDLERKFCEHYGIDRDQLERERRALLEQARARS